MLRQRRQQASDSSSSTLPTPVTPATQSASASSSSSSRRKMQSEPASERQPLLERDGADNTADAAGADQTTDQTTAPASSSPSATDDAETTWLQRNQWVALALTSGACAAFNGVFAKLTTTELTTRLSQAVARLVGLDAAEAAVEVAVRGTFFALNLVFNGVMWTLFTRALARGHSATQVSIMNTSANFVLTALLGFAIFSEALPPLWWAGAALLVAGNVIIGRKDEGDEKAHKAVAPVGATDSSLPADEAAVAATTAAAATVGASKAAKSNKFVAASETPASEGRRSSRRLKALREPESASASTSVSNASTVLASAKEEDGEGSEEDEDIAQI